MILSYRLRQKTLASNHQYRMQFMDQFGMLLLDDGTMLNKEGQVVYQQEVAPSIGYVEEQDDIQQLEERNKDSLFQVQ